VVDLAVTATGRGYVVVTQDGRVFPFGDAVDHGDWWRNPGRDGLEIAGIALSPVPGQTGYTMVTRSGNIRKFGPGAPASEGFTATNPPVGACTYMDADFASIFAEATNPYISTITTARPDGGLTYSCSVSQTLQGRSISVTTISLVTSGTQSRWDRGNELNVPGASMSFITTDRFNNREVTIGGNLSYAPLSVEMTINRFEYAANIVSDAELIDLTTRWWAEWNRIRAGTAIPIALR
jgi:hypothetical protein